METIIDREPRSESEGIALRQLPPQASDERRGGLFLRGAISDAGGAAAVGPGRRTKLMSLNLHLPDFPASRLCYEAAIAWNFRHLDETPLDPHTSPWPVIRGAVHAFLRHSLADYDDRLRARCEHDPVYRDRLAGQIALAAKRKYPWLDNDPRPFPEEEKSPFFDRIAKHLADLRGLRDQMLSASRDLARSGGASDHVFALRREVDEVNKQIQRAYSFLTTPETKSDADGTFGRALILPRLEGPREYFFHSERELPPNRIDFVGFRCSRCGASVARRKGLVALGQGFDRTVIWSCFCLTYSVFQPPKAHVVPMTPEKWTQLGERAMAPEVKEEVSV
jgi:hypothetical protein